MPLRPDLGAIRRADTKMNRFACRLRHKECKGRNRAPRRNAAFMRQRPARVNVLPDKSGVPAGTMRLDLSQYQGAPGCKSRLQFKLLVLIVHLCHETVRWPAGGVLPRGL
jgi:hypothetical protein